MKKGDVVEIYKDPMTMMKLEGKAKLLSFIKPIPDFGLEYWRVKFLSDGMIVDRTVKVEGEE